MSDTRVFISPDYYNVPARADNGGIRRVAEAMMKYLPSFGVQVVHNLQQADVICNHGSSKIRFGTVPIVNVNHGFYWSRQPWGNGYKEVNEQLCQAMCMAVAHTAPSEWVANAIRRGGLFYPEVVYHGIDPDDFPAQTEHDDYVLWNKARADLVSDPNDMLRLAQGMSDTKFLSTIGNPSDNVEIMGVIPYDKMKTVLQRAGVYLATARETFGIGTLEALSCGVPVAGWDWGGQTEIVIPGETGYLAPPGDYGALAECVRKCISERDRLSVNAAADARARWTWPQRIEQYAEIFKRVSAPAQGPKVSVIVTAYKLDTYLPDCLESIQKQDLRDFECLVIDDASLTSTRIIVEDFARSDPRIRYIPTPYNLGLPGARNFGYHRSRGRFIRHVDADDFLAPSALGMEVDALEADPGIHIVYGHLETVNEDGSRVFRNGEPERGGWPPDGFSWIEQMAHLNQIPSCAMMRREVMTRTGGYRSRMRRNEDAEFWCRATSLGFRAKKFTQAVTYFHRQRADSKGNLEWKTEGAEPDWTAMFPWRVGARNHREAVTSLRRTSGRHPLPSIVPWSAQGKCPDAPFWPVNDHAYPVVSVIVTCGPGHEPFLLDALDSIWAQTYPDWECVVVNDTGKEWPDYIMGAPWAKLVSTGGNKGASAARNEGFAHTRGKYIVWLDADDIWMPWFLDLMVSYSEQHTGVIYSDLIMDDGKEKKVYTYPEYDPARVVRSMSYPGTSIMFPRRAVEEVFKLQGGWDNGIPGMEDWDFQIAIHSLGFCAFHIKEPLFLYRTYTSTKRETDYAKIDDIRAYLDQKWARYRKGDEKMCGCSQPKPVRTSAMRGTGSGAPFSAYDVPKDENTTQMVSVEYVGPLIDEFPIRSRVDRSVFYRFANSDNARVKTVFAGDVPFLTGQLGPDGNPLYRQLTPQVSVQERNPADVLGVPVAA